MLTRVIVLLIFGVVVAASAQPAAKVPRVGVIGEATPSERYLAGFDQGLRELGYKPGQTIVVEYRYAEGLLDRVPKLASELIGLKVDVLVVGGSISAQSVKAITTTVPIVFVLVGDPVAAGLAATLARPGGNTTGLSNIATDLTGKQLELLRIAVPQLSRIAILTNPESASANRVIAAAREAAQALGFEVRFFEVRRPTDLPGAFSALAAWRAGAVLAVSDPVFGTDLPGLSKLAVRHRVPAMYGRKEFAEAGGLLAYGPSFADNYRRAASYVDKILKGAKPANLPVERPTTFELAINMQTAKTLGLTLPPALVSRAAQVIDSP